MMKKKYGENYFQSIIQLSSFTEHKETVVRSIYLDAYVETDFFKLINLYDLVLFFG